MIEKIVEIKMEEKKKIQQERTGRSRQPEARKKSKKMSYRKKIVMFQIGAITLAIFLTLMIGAVMLTRIFVDENKSAETVNAKPRVERRLEMQRKEKLPVKKILRLMAQNQLQRKSPPRSRKVCSRWNPYSLQSARWETVP